MVILAELAHVVEILDQFSAPLVVDKALREAGIGREALREGPGYVPYLSEIILLEHVARSEGDSHLGARVGNSFNLLAYGSAAYYVLSAPDLAAAIERIRRTNFLTHPGTEIVVQEKNSHLFISFKCELNTVIGYRNISEGALFVFINVIRHLLGQDWCPAWIEIIDDGHATGAVLEELAASPVRTRASVPALAINKADLHVPNLVRLPAESIVVLQELPSLMGIKPPQKMEDYVWHLLRMQYRQGVLSEDGVARHFSVGRRTLQRRLSADGLSFRDVKARFLAERAQALLKDSNLSVEKIARSLGYTEPNSFRRAFRKWTGLSPSAYRAINRHQIAEDKSTGIRRVDY